MERIWSSQTVDSIQLFVKYLLKKMTIAEFKSFAFIIQFIILFFQTFLEVLQIHSRHH